MSHIYDALNKSKGEDPKRPETGEQSTPEPPAPPPAEGRRAVAPKKRIEGSLLANPHHEFLRELETLRDNVEVNFGRAERRVVGFAGAIAGEGASTLAVHFAYLQARLAGKRVLLIDADMARAHQSLSDAVADEAGLSELLLADQPLENLVLATEDEHLHFLPSGRDRIHHVESIGAGRLRPIFEMVGRTYDSVVVDHAPIREHPEAPIVASACDGVVLVVRAHQTRREIVQRALSELNFSRCRILGTILNARKESLPGFLQGRV